MKTYRICLLPGDGIGPEIIAEGVKVLDAVGEKYGVGFTYDEALIGGIAIDETGEALPAATLAAAKASDAVLLAAVGGPLAAVRDGDRIRLSVKDKRIDLLVEPEEVARRLATHVPPPAPKRGYKALYRRSVTQAPEGCDFDFLSCASSDRP